MSSNLMPTILGTSPCGHLAIAEPSGLIAESLASGAFTGAGYATRTQGDVAKQTDRAVKPAQGVESRGPRAWSCPATT